MSVYEKCSIYLCALHCLLENTSLALIVLIRTVGLLDRLPLLCCGPSDQRQTDNKDNSSDLGTLAVGRRIPPKEPSYSYKLIHI